LVVFVAGIFISTSRSHTLPTSDKIIIPEDSQPEIRRQSSAIGDGYCPPHAKLCIEGTTNSPAELIAKASSAVPFEDNSRQYKVGVSVVPVGPN